MKFKMKYIFQTKGRVGETGALKILALPKLALTPPAPRFWHTGGFDDKKCVNATRNN